MKRIILGATTLSSLSLVVELADPSWLQPRGKGRAREDRCTNNALPAEMRFWLKKRRAAVGADGVTTTLDEGVQSGEEAQMQRAVERERRGEKARNAGSSGESGSI